MHFSPSQLLYLFIRRFASNKINSHPDEQVNPHEEKLFVCCEPIFSSAAVGVLKLNLINRAPRDGYFAPGVGSAFNLCVPGLIARTCAPNEEKWLH